MKRRDFIALLAGAVVGRSLPACAQSLTQPVIGFLNIGSPDAFASLLAAFKNGLQAGGHVEGRDVTIEYRWAEGNYDRLREQAADLVRREVSLIAATGGLVVARAASEATRTIPVLFIAGSDPVREGLIGSFSRPGGNATGVSVYTSLLIRKRVELVRDLLPDIAKIAVLVNPKTPSGRIERDDTENAVKEAGLELRVLEATSEHELEAAFASAAAAHADALLVAGDGFFTSRRVRIVGLAASHALPTNYPWREYALAGGLASYGPSIAGAYYRIGEYASRILKGAPPGDLPVQLPKTYELVINLTTAKTLGLTISPWVLARADEVIE